MMTVTVRGADRVAANMARAANGAMAAQRAGMERATGYLKGRIVRNRMSGPRGADRLAVDTGRARQSVQSTVTLRGSIIEGRVGSPVRYVRAHEIGSGPVVIRPKRPGGVLAFMVNGTMRFARFVRHPGVRARHMFRNETDEQRPMLVKILGRDVATAIVALAKGQR